MGVLVGAVQSGDPLAGPLALVGVVFVLLQVLTPLHQAVGANLGDRTAAWLYDRLTDGVRRAARASATSRTRSSTGDLTVAREFDLGMTGPPLSISMDFIAGGLVEMVGGLASALVLFALRLVGAARARRRLAGARTGCCGRARSGATATPTRCAARSATPTTPTGWPSTRRRPRSCGCSAWPAGRSTASSPAGARLHELQYEATRLRERSVLSSLVIVVRAPTCSCSGRWPTRPRRRPPRPRPRGGVRPGRGRRVADRLRRAQLGPRRRRRAGGRGRSARAGDGGRRARCRPAIARRPTACRRARSASATSTFAYPGSDAARCSTGFDLTIPAGLVAGHRRPERRRQDDAGQAAVPPLRPAGRRDRGRRHRPARARPRRLARAGRPRCSRTSSASSCRCATTWRPAGAPDEVVLAALAEAGAARPRRPRHPAGQGLRRAAPTCPAGSGSGSRWPGRCARCGSGAGVVLLDEPTAQLDVRGEAEIFERVLRRHPALHDDPHLAPLLDRAPRRPHLRARARPGRRAGHATTS